MGLVRPLIIQDMGSIIFLYLGIFRIAQLNTDFIILHKTKLITWNMGGNIPKISRIKSITQGGVKNRHRIYPFIRRKCISMG